MISSAAMTSDSTALPICASWSFTKAISSSIAPTMPPLFLPMADLLFELGDAFRKLPIVASERLDERGDGGGNGQPHHLPELRLVGEVRGERAERASEHHRPGRMRGGEVACPGCGRGEVVHGASSGRRRMAMRNAMTTSAATSATDFAVYHHTK